MEQSKKLCVAFLNRNGGGNYFTYELCNALSKQTEVQLIIHDKNELLKEYQLLSVDLIVLKHFQRTKLSFLSFLFLGDFINNYLLLRKNVRSEKMISTMTSAYFPYIVCLLKLTKKFEYIPIIHDPILHSGEKHLYHKALQLLDIWLSTRIATVSKFACSQLKKFTNKTIIELKHGIIKPVNSNVILGNPFRIPQDKIVVSFIGRIRKYKGIDDFINAILLNESDHLHFLIAGSGDIKSQDLLEKKSNVTILNRYLSDDELNHLFINSHCICLPYRDATQSGVVPMALHYGKYIIATNVGALPEQLSDNFATIVDPGSPESLNEQFNLLHEVDYNSVEENIRRYKGKYLSWKSISHQFIQELRN